MMAQCSTDLITNEELYLIKVGLSRDIDKRKSSYKSHNPAAVMIFTTAGTEREENACHNFLYNYGTRYQGEWFNVSKEFFHHCLKYGFINFPLKNKKQNIYIKKPTIAFNMEDFKNKDFERHYGDKLK
jgi:hypothetical protein